MEIESKKGPTTASTTAATGKVSRDQPMVGFKMGKKWQNLHQRKVESGKYLFFDRILE